jgi:hypothetical protein
MSDERWKTWNPWRLKRAQAAEAATAAIEAVQPELAGEQSTSRKENIYVCNSGKNAGDTIACTGVAEGK